MDTVPQDRDSTPEEQTTELLVQRVQRRIQAFDRRHPLVWDLHLTAFWTLAALIDADGGWRNVARNPDTPVLLVLAMSLGLSLPLLWRRSHPRPYSWPWPRSPSSTRAAPGTGSRQ